MCLQRTYGSVAQTFCEKGTGSGLQARKRYPVVHSQTGTQENHQMAKAKSTACTYIPVCSIGGMMHRVQIKWAISVRCKRLRVKHFSVSLLPILLSYNSVLY